MSYHPSSLSRIFFKYTFFTDCPCRRGIVKDPHPFFRNTAWLEPFSASVYPCLSSTKRTSSNDISFGSGSSMSCPSISLYPMSGMIYHIRYHVNRYSLAPWSNWPLPLHESGIHPSTGQSILGNSRSTRVSNTGIRKRGGHQIRNRASAKAPRIAFPRSSAKRSRVRFRACQASRFMGVVSERVTPFVASRDCAMMTASGADSSRPSARSCPQQICI